MGGGVQPLVRDANTCSNSVTDTDAEKGTITTAALLTQKRPPSTAAALLTQKRTPIQQQRY
eukprot:6987831-Pyramimonas_sp.AAC.1